MAEVLVRFAAPLSSKDGVEYEVRACGAPVKHVENLPTIEDGQWEAWVEFHPTDGRAPLVTPRETTQPNRADAEYWATGLSPVYLEGAFERAVHTAR